MTLISKETCAVWHRRVCAYHPICVGRRLYACVSACVCWRSLAVCMCILRCSVCVLVVMLCVRCLCVSGCLCVFLMFLCCCPSFLCCVPVSLACLVCFSTDLDPFATICMSFSGSISLVFLPRPLPCVVLLSRRRALLLLGTVLPASLSFVLPCAGLTFRLCRSLICLHSDYFSWNCIMVHCFLPLGIDAISLLHFDFSLSYFPSPLSYTFQHCSSYILLSHYHHLLNLTSHIRLSLTLIYSPIVIIYISHQSQLSRHDTSQYINQY